MNLRRIALLFTILMFSIALTAYAEAPAQPSAPTGQTLTADVPLQVTLTGAPVDLAYAGTRGEILTFSARSLAPAPGIDTMLELLNENGVRLGFNDDMVGAQTGFNPLDSVIPSIRVLSDGVITVRVSSFDPAVSGTVEVLAASEGHGISITGSSGAGNGAVTTVQGSVAANGEDCTPLSLLAGEIVTATAHALAGGLDTTLALRAPDGSNLAFNDDHSLDDPALSLFDSAVDAVTIPADGSYQLCVSGFAGDSGPYELTITRTPGGAAARPTPAPGSSPDEQVISDFVPADNQFVMTVDWQAGDVYTLTARALNADLDTQMGIFPDRSNDMLAGNDDHSSSATDLAFFDSRITNFIVPASGPYDIVVGDYYDVGGPFELTITRTGQNAPLGAPAVTSVSGSVRPNGLFEHEITLPAGAYVTIKVAATANSPLDPQVTLIAPGGVVAADNDDHTSGDPVLSPTDSLIRNFHVIEAGVYTIEIRGYRGGSGDFTLTIETLQ